MAKQQEVGSNALIFNDQGAFLVVRRSDNDEYFPGSWELPGGGVSDGETPQESLKREIMEECGLSVKVSYPLGVHLFFVENDTVKVTEITFFCTLENKLQQVLLSHEHADFRWITGKDLHTLELSEYMQAVIADALENPMVKNL